MVDAGVPPIALVDWEDGETLVAVADGASGLVRPEPPVPVEQLIFPGRVGRCEAGRRRRDPLGAAAGRARVRIRLRHHGRRTGTGRRGPRGRHSGWSHRARVRCQPVDRGWPEYALTDLDDRPLGRCATVDGLFDTPEPQPRPWLLLGRVTQRCVRYRQWVHHWGTVVARCVTGRTSCLDSWISTTT